MYFKATSKAVTLGATEPTLKLPMIGLNFVHILRNKKFRVDKRKAKEKCQDPHTVELH